MVKRIVNKPIEFLRDIEFILCKKGEEMGLLKVSLDFRPNDFIGYMKDLGAAWNQSSLCNGVYDNQY